MEEEIIIVIKPRRADVILSSDAQRTGVQEAMPTAYAFKSYEAAVKFLAANLKG